MRRRRSLGVATVAAAGLALVVAACGRGGSGGSGGPLHEAGSRLSAVHAGRLTMQVTAAAGTTTTGHDVGFSLEGPFELRTAKGALPVARLTYAQLAGQQRRESTFLSTGNRAFVEVHGVDYELSPAQTATLRQGGAGSLQGLHLDQWAKTARVSDGGTADGVAVQRIDADVDPVPALNDIFGLAGQLGADQQGTPKRIEGAAADQLRHAVRSATVVVLTGTKDRLLRSLQLDITFQAQSVGELQSALGPLAGARLHVLLAVAGPNQPIHVDGPTSARPVKELIGR